MNKNNRAFIYVDAENIPIVDVIGPCLRRLTEDRDLNIISIKVFDCFFPYSSKVVNGDGEISRNEATNYFYKMCRKRDLFEEYFIEPIVCLGNYKNKNSVDMKIVSEIRSDIINCDVDIVILFSNDSDYIQICRDCKKAGKEVWIFGDPNNSNKILRNYSDIFVDYTDPSNRKRNPKEIFNRFLIDYFKTRNIDKEYLGTFGYESIFKNILNYKELSYNKFKEMFVDLMDKNKFYIETAKNNSESWVCKIQTKIDNVQNKVNSVKNKVNDIISNDVDKKNDLDEDLN